MPRFPAITWSFSLSCSPCWRSPASSVPWSGKGWSPSAGTRTLAQSVGIDTMRDKVVFLSISTLIAGLAGGLYAAYMGSLMAEQAHFLGSFEMLLNVMIGGVGTMAGPVIGGILLPTLTEGLHFLGGLRLVVYGVAPDPDHGFSSPGNRRRPAGGGPEFREEGRGEMSGVLLEARDVTKDFGGLQAISEVSFNIRKGEIFSVIGPNGAGKTTLFNLITAFLPLTRGEIFFRGGKDLRPKALPGRQKGDRPDLSADDPL